MFIVAGPPGGGKSTVFGLRAFTDRIFNADDRPAELNGGSYQGIPLAIRTQVNREFERFVHESDSSATYVIVTWKPAAFASV